jgi:hypothetical protein
MLQDTILLARVKQILDKSEVHKSSVAPRQAGWGKGIFTYIADHFNETSRGFKDYIPQK